MIISASRRTDIPGLYLPWLLARLRAGYLLSRNPFNHHQVRRVSLLPEDVDALVLWTRNGRPLLKALPELHSYGMPLLIHYSITGYPKVLEPRVPPQAQALRCFIELSQALTPAQMIWRYDPVLLCNWMPVEWHLRNFEQIARQLQGHCQRVVISFADLYRKSERQLNRVAGLEYSDIATRPEQLYPLAQGLAHIALRYQLEIESCAEALDLAHLGIRHGRCIDPELLNRLFDLGLADRKDRSQRPACGCAPAIDIGQYDSCPQGCAYCYANHSRSAALKRLTRHQPKSEFLID